MLDLIEAILKTLQKEVLPKFDKGKEAGAFDMLSILKNLHSFKDRVKLLHTPKFALFRAVKKEIPKLLQQYAKKKQANQSPQNYITDQIRQQKKEFFIRAGAIDSTQFEINFDALLTVISTQNFSNCVNDDELTEETLYALEDILFQNEPAFEISHPVIFELVIAITQLLNQLPETLPDLIPFLNPKALAVDLHNGFAGTGVKALTGQTFLMTHIESSHAEGSHFLYKFTIFTDKDETVIEIDGDDYYQHYASEIIGFLLPGIERYINSHEKTPAVENELKKAEILQKYIQEETQTIEAELTAHKQSWASMPKPENNHNPFELILFYREEIQARNQFKINSLMMKDKLAARVGNYHTLPIRNLLVNVSYRANLDDPYFQGPLPTALPGRKIATGEVAHIPIKSCLLELVSEKTKELSEFEKILSNDIEQLLILEKDAIEQWFAKEKATHTLFQTRLKALDREINTPSIPTTSDKKLTADESIEATKVSLAAVQLEAQQLEETSNALAQLAKEMHDSLQCVADSELQERLQAVYVDSFEQLNKLREVTCQRNDAIKNTRRSLEAQLEKLESEKAFTESMSKADPETISQLLKKTEKQLDQSASQIEEKQGILLEKQTRLKESQKSVALQSDEMQKLNLERELLEKQAEQLKHKANAQVFVLKQPLKWDEINADDLPGSIAYFKQHQAKLQTEASYAAMHDVLIAVKLCLSEHKDKIPFAQLDKLVLLNPVNGRKGAATGFDYLLQILGCRDRTYWRTYRDKQERLFSSPGIAEISDAVVKLDDLITNTMKSNYERYEQADLFNQNLEILELIFDELKRTQQQLTENNEHIVLGEAQTNTIEKDTARIETEIGEISVAIGEEKKEQEKLNKTLSLLRNMHAFMVTIQDLSTKIGAIKSMETSFKNKELFLQKSKQLNESISTAVELQEKCSQQINGDTNYQSTQKLFTKLVQTSKDQAVPLTPNYIEGLLKELGAEVDSSFANLNNEFTKLQNISLEQMKGYLERIEQLSLTLTQRREKVKLFQSNWVELNNASFTDKYIENEEVINKFKEASKAKLITVLLNQLLKVDAFKPDATYENIAIHQINKKSLAKIKIFLDAMAQQELIIKQGTEYTDLQNKYDKALKINAEIKQRIDQRSELVQAHRSALDECVDAKKYKSLISDLKSKLEAFNASGNSSDLGKALSLAKTPFPGVHLQSCLDRLAVAIIDYDRLIPLDYMQAVIETNYQFEAQKVLSTAEATYKETIYLLYKKITVMQTYGEQLAKVDSRCSEVAINLANSLKTEVDRFIVVNQNENANPDTLQRFQKEFNTRLHSQDDLMRKHRKAWKPIIANIAIATTGLGLLAIAIQLIVSKASTGQCSFFFEKTKREKQIESIEETSSKLAVSA